MVGENVHGACTCSELAHRDLFLLFVLGTSCFYCFVLARCWFEYEWGPAPAQSLFVGMFWGSGNLDLSVSV